MELSGGYLSVCQGMKEFGGTGWCRPDRHDTVSAVNY